MCMAITHLPRWHDILWLFLGQSKELFKNLRPKTDLLAGAVASSSDTLVGGWPTEYCWDCVSYYHLFTCFSQDSWSAEMLATTYQAMKNHGGVRSGPRPIKPVIVPYCLLRSVSSFSSHSPQSRWPFDLHFVSDGINSFNLSPSSLSSEQSRRA